MDISKSRHYLQTSQDEDQQLALLGVLCFVIIVRSKPGLIFQLFLLERVDPFDSFSLKRQNVLDLKAAVLSMSRLFLVLMVSSTHKNILRITLKASQHFQEMRL